MRIRRGTAAIPFVMTLLAAGCASTGATLGSGVGDAYLRRAPWYAGTGAASEAVVAHLPIEYRAEAFDPTAREGSAASRLIADMNAWLDSAGTSVRISAAPAGTPPDVQFGCERHAGDDCEEPAEDMRLAVGRPSRDWVEGTAAAAAGTGAGRVLVITLEIGNYMPRQRSILGAKEVELGTGHTVGVPWLTSLDRPVSVLQLTGALMDTTGRAVRIGAEGLVARPTNIVAAGFGIQALITEKDVEALRTARREDLPGQPLVWQEALRNLVTGLTGARR